MTQLYLQDLMHKRVSEEELISILKKEDINTIIINGNLAFSGFYDEAWLDLLIKHGLNVNFKTESGENPLWYTNYKSSGLLIKKGTDVNNIDNAGRNALWYAYHDDEKYKVLVQAGINVNIIDNNGENVLFKAPPQMFDFLISHGADPYILNNQNENLLFRNQIEIWKFFDEKNIYLDYNTINSEGLTLMEANVLDGSTERVKYLKNRVSSKDSVLLYLLSHIMEEDAKNLAMNSKMVLFSEIFDDFIVEENLLQRNKNGLSLLDLMIEMSEKIPHAMDINMSSLKKFKENISLKDKLSVNEDSDDYDEYNLLSKNDFKNINNILKAVEEKTIIQKEISNQNDPVKIKKRI